ncbi:hypothetical protein Mp_7g13520 [Marchantia polymorpha subsp. ruderalis]|uniref:Uncharacterized protein n=2 Tax=Marchantia polymorpha TaxID=3197 RepID=A0AAF6BZ76_MARPO|nr:hypothetical protein MARPO_0009s0038 [Marchantia polymorpha]BBN17310.1 hypothetical protein Mp_7g13520 [Marchantia polymorpha subsp. ruderalis]|eukprot:PTQ46915.1 hypothetical protein MARPO_0009s0038 [Marchantia polymorpha]
MFVLARFGWRLVSAQESGWCGVVSCSRLEGCDRSGGKAGSSTGWSYFELIYLVLLQHLQSL